MRIITDSAADFTREELSKHGIRCVQTGITVDGQSVSGDSFTPQSFWALLGEGRRIKTSQPSPQAFLDEFEAANDAGEESVCVCISSALSGTAQCAQLAASMTEGSNVHVVDSLTGAAAQKLLVLHACRLREEGKLMAQDVAQRLTALRSRVRLLASLDTLDALVQSGRIPKAMAAIGARTQIKPLLKVTPDGHITLAGTAFGRHRAIDALAKRIAALKIDRNFPVIPLYSRDTANCAALIDRLKALGVGVSEELLSAIGPSIAAHIGPGAYGVAFVEAE